MDKEHALDCAVVLGVDDEECTCGAAVEVTQEDRDFAARWASDQYLRGLHINSAIIEEGKADSCSLVQQAARHRLRSFTLPSVPTEADVERAARIIQQTVHGDGSVISYWPSEEHLKATVRVVIAALSLPTGIELPPFKEAWGRYEAEGYQYGRDALGNVEFGYRIANEELGALRTTSDKRIFDLLESIVAPFPKGSEPWELRAGFARGTGGVNMTYLTKKIIKLFERAIANAGTYGIPVWPPSKDKNHD